MSLLFILIGIIYFSTVLIKEKCVKQVPKGMDWRQITIDSARGVSPKERERRMYSGYYNQHFDHPNSK